MYLSFSSFLSGVWSTVSLRALPLRHNMTRLSPTLPTTSSMPSLSRATVAVVPAFIPGATETYEKISSSTKPLSKVLTTTWCISRTRSHTLQHEHMDGKPCSRLRKNYRYSHSKQQRRQSHMQVELLQNRAEVQSKCYSRYV